MKKTPFTLIKKDFYYKLLYFTAALILCLAFNFFNIKLIFYWFCKPLMLWENSDKYYNFIFLNPAEAFASQITLIIVTATFFTTPLLVFYWCIAQLPGLSGIKAIKLFLVTFINIAFTICIVLLSFKLLLPLLQEFLLSFEVKDSKQLQ